MISDALPYVNIQTKLCDILEMDWLLSALGWELSSIHAGYQVWLALSIGIIPERSTEHSWLSALRKFSRVRLVMLSFWLLIFLLECWTRGISAGSLSYFFVLLGHVCLPVPDFLPRYLIKCCKWKWSAYRSACNWWDADPWRWRDVSGGNIGGKSECLVEAMSGPVRTFHFCQRNRNRRALLIPNLLLRSREIWWSLEPPTVFGTATPRAKLKSCSGLWDLWNQNSINVFY